MNIFGSTKYEYTEEDRLTNAFLCLLEKSEDVLIYQLLRHIGISLPHGKTLHINSQVPYISEGSRPDARIASDSFVVIIENKRFDNLDEEQMVRHINGILHYEPAGIGKYLLCLSKSYTVPRWFTKLGDDHVNAVKLIHVHWGIIYDYLVKHQTESIITKFIVDEFCEYLRGFGYQYYSMNNLHVSSINDICQGKYSTEHLYEIAKILTNKLDHASGVNHVWVYHINDSRWIKKYNVFFQFHSFYKDRMLRFNFECSCNGTGWFGISEWSQQKYRAQVISAFNNEKCCGSNTILNDGKYHFEPAPFHYNRQLSIQEIEDIFNSTISDQILSESNDLFKLINAIREK